MSEEPSKAKEMRKIEELKEALREYEAEKEEKAKAYTIKELAKASEEIQSFEHPKYGIIRYGVLTVRDLFELAIIEDEKERLITAIWKMLYKADKSVTKEDVAKLPWDLFTALLKVSGLAVGPLP